MLSGGAELAVSLLFNLTMKEISDRSQVMLIGPRLTEAFNRRVGEWVRDGIVARLWAKDTRVWTGVDEDRWLGWLDVLDAEVPLEALSAFSRNVVDTGLTDVLLLGIGGSSLCPEVLSGVLGPVEEAPVLHILDSTDPAEVQRIESRLDLSRTLCIVSSKSGTTLEPTVLMEYFFDRISQLVGVEEAGLRFVAVTDPGSALEDFACRVGFRRVWHGVPDIGGRFSALSNFGLVPATVSGLDVPALIDRARTMVARCGPSETPNRNPGVKLGLVLGAAADLGRDKITLVLSPAIRALGGWLEQLLAESTGKAGRGLIPIVDEEIGSPSVYGDDRFFVYLRLETEPSSVQDAAVSKLSESGQPVVKISLSDRLAVAAEFFRWEIATAVCGAVIGVNPFDQPDVEASKEAARELTAGYESNKVLPLETPLARIDGVALYADPQNTDALLGAVDSGAEVKSILAAHLGRLVPRDYFAILAFLDRNENHWVLLQQLRHLVRDARNVATCVGFGPRFLHSTGQVFKGGPGTGVFLQITCDDVVDLPIPGRGYTFGALKAAQSFGDFGVLVSRSRRVLRVHLGSESVVGLKWLVHLVEELMS